MYSSRNKTVFCFAILLVWLLAFACEPKNEANRIAYPVYLNVDSLINSNIAFFRNKKPSLTKQATIDNQTNTITTTPPDSLAWAEELDIFREMNAINKPLNRDAYEVQKELKDSHSNLKICRYTAKTEVPLKSLEVYYQDSFATIRKLKAVYKEKNALYASSRYLEIEMQNVPDKNVITLYRIEGGQKMILGDSIHFKLVSTVSFTE